VKRPVNVELEAAVLGRLLLTPAHQAVFSAVARLVDAGGQWDHQDLRTRLEAAERWGVAGGHDGLARLTDAGVGAHSMRHVKRLASIGAARRVWDAAYEVLEGGASLLADPDEWAAKAEHRMQTAFDRVEHGGPEQVNLGDAIHEVKRWRRGGGAPGVKIGFDKFDLITGGLQNGALYVIGARIRVGKSALAMSIAEYIAGVSRIPVLSFSLEMSSMQQHLRLVAMGSGVDLAKLNTGSISDEEEEALDALGKRERPLLWIDDTAKLNVNRITARFRGWRRRLGCKRCVLFVDYLQLVKGTRSRGDSREQEVAGISVALKELARREKVPVVVLAQLNRGADKDDRPRLAHFRESGAIEADADVALLIHRPECEAKPEDKPKVRGLAELIVAKNRMGPEFTVRMHYDGPRTRFTEARSAKEEET
jgi:replicative DNA helicase